MDLKSKLKQQAKLRIAKQIQEEYPIHRQLNAISAYARATNKELIAIKRAVEFLMNDTVYALSNKELGELRAAGDMVTGISKIRVKGKAIQKQIDNLTDRELSEFKIDES